jgi:hypothetical protein
VLLENFVPLLGGEGPHAEQLSGAVEGRYVIRDRRAGGELVIVPDTSIEAIRDEQGRAKRAAPRRPHMEGVLSSGRG